MAVEYTDDRDRELIHYLVTNDAGYTFCGMVHPDGWETNGEGDCAHESTESWANGSVCVVCADLFDRQYK